MTREGKAQLEIKIGDDKEAFTGKKTYHLSYLLRVLDKTNAFWHQYLIFKTYLFGWLILPFALIFLVLLVILVNIEKKEGHNIGLFRELLGFKQFLEVAEKDRLKLLAEESPSYFYDILPYVHVFNLSSLWIDKFKDIEVSPSAWFDGQRQYERGLRDYLRAIDFLLSNLSSYTESSGGNDTGSSGGGGAW